MASDIEFSRTIRVDGLGPDQTSMRIEATAAECKALTQRFDLIKLSRLTADLVIEVSDNNKTLRVHGRFDGLAVQTCVVTLQAVKNKIFGEFDRLFGDSPLKDLIKDGELVFDHEDEDPPDEIVAGVIDVGEMVSEEFGLSLDPYPRAPDVKFSDPNTGGGVGRESGKKPSPFAKLAELKKKMDEKD